VGEVTFLKVGKTMLFPGSIPRLGLFLTLSAFLTQFSPATLSAPPAHSPQTPLALTPQQQDQLHDLVARVLQHADKAGCKKNSCTILVANFASLSGSTSILGMQLADAVSEQMTSLSKGFQIADRHRLQSYLEAERIPGKLLHNDDAIRWLGKQLGATAVLTGTIEDEGGWLRVQVKFFSCGKPKAGPLEKISFPASDSKTLLSPIEPFPLTLPVPDSPSVPLILTAGKDGVSAPRCSYCPPPNYTDPARVAKLNGIVLLQLTISGQGRMVDARVVRGLPFGLNESAIRAVRDWQFQPATRNGEPVTCMVMMETNFRLY
jgi:TonB family protein